jgi:hypothetical protein
MKHTEFEKAFADFIDRCEYDKAQNALFDMVCISFKVGWQAAPPGTAVRYRACSQEAPQVIAQITEYIPRSRLFF